MIELAGVPIWQSWTGMEDEAEVWARWLRSDAVRRFESGRADADAFAREIVAEFGLSIEPAEFLREFRGWPRGVFPAARELVDGLRGRVEVGCLSNSNALHWPRFLGEMGLEDAFDHHFSSHELGALKPDREIFDVVARRLGRAPGKILFLDDNQLNVDGAREAGFHAELAKGPDGARAALEKAGW